ncbi:MAG: hypothetical protein JRJ77_16380 [Deltaproteobacteria bacterium]|nr:hypothetical protein [Deltaproteobacteria bacterium]
MTKLLKLKINDEQEFKMKTWLSAFLLPCFIKDYLSPNHGQDRFPFEFPTIEGGVSALGLKGVGM